MQPAFDAKNWKTGPAGFATKGSPQSMAKTTWEGKEIWVRREVEVSDLNFDHLKLLVNHDDDVEVYINGVLAASCANCWIDEYKQFPVSEGAKA